MGNAILRRVFGSAANRPARSTCRWRWTSHDGRAAEFHDYAIEWVPGRARFLVDGVLMHEATEEMERMVLPQNILLTIWASDATDWAGPVDGTTAPTSAQYDWIRVYRYTGQ